MLLPLGQGKPLDAAFPYKGEWIIENLVFLYRADGRQKLAGLSPRFTATAPAVDGKIAIGFDASQLAPLFDVDIDAIFTANKNGTFALVNAEVTAPSHGGKAAKRYVFQLEDRLRALIDEVGDTSGVA